MIENVEAGACDGRNDDTGDADDGLLLLLLPLLLGDSHA